MTFTPQNVRLEVEVTPPSLNNVVANPNGSLGAWGWITPVANTTLNNDGLGTTPDLPVYQFTVATQTWGADGPDADALADTITFTVSGTVALTDYFAVGDEINLVTSSSQSIAGVTAVSDTSITVWNPFVDPPTPTVTHLRTSGSNLVFQTSVSQAVRYETELMDATAGMYYQARSTVLRVTASHTIRYELVFYASNKTTVLSTTTQSAAKGIGDSFYGPFQAPANTAYVALRVRFYNGTGTTNPAANAFVEFNRVMIAESATNASVQTRTNLITDPSVQTGISAFTAFSGTALTWSTSTPKFGTRCLQAVSTDGGAGVKAFSNISLSTNSQYTISFYVLSNHNRSFRIDRIMESSTGYKRRIAGQTISLPANRYVRYEHTFTTGGFNQLDRIEMLTSNSGIFRFDGFLLEKANSALPYFDGSIVPAGYASSAWNGTANASTSTAQTAAGVFDYSDYHEWMNILPGSADIDITGGELDIKTLTATLLDESFDPYVSTVIKPGRAIRLRAYAGEAYGYTLDKWITTYTGEIERSDAEYDYKDGAKVPVRTKVIAVDNVAKLAAKNEPRIVVAHHLPFILEGNGVPWNVTEITGHVNGTVQGTDDNKTLLDQIALARDSYVDAGRPGPAFAWVDRRGVLRFETEEWLYLGSDIDKELHLTDNAADVGLLGSEFAISYSDLPAGFSTGNTINVLNLTVQSWDSGAQQMVETKYTFENVASIRASGRYAKDMTVFAYSGFNASTFGNAIVNGSNGTPTRFIESATIPCKSDEDLYWFAALDLYTPVYITNAKAGLTEQKHLVSSLKHSISVSSDGAKWITTIAFAPTGSVASPAVQPAVSTTKAGTPFLDMSKNGSTYTLANNNVDTISGWTINTNVGMGAIAGSSVVITQPGTYLVSFTATFPAGTSNRRVVDIRKGFVSGVSDGTIVVRGGEVTTASTVAIQASIPVYLNAGEIIAGTVFQLSGASMTLGGTSYLHHFTVYRIGS